LISLLPLTTQSYVADAHWCTLDRSSKDGRIWGTLSDCTLVVALLYGSIKFSYILYYSWSEEVVSKAILSTVGIYITLSWIPWIITLILTFTGLFQEVPDIANIVLYWPVYYLTPIAYSICFAYNYSLFMNYEHETATARPSSSMQISFAAFEAALSDLREDDADDKDNYESHSNVKTSLLSSNHILEVSVHSVEEISNVDL
jgi:hypothetical protein